MRSARDNLKFMEEMMRMANGAMGSFSEIRGQIKDMVKDGIDRVAEELDMVTREEFDRVEMVALRAREKQEALEKRIAALEKQLQAGKKPAEKTKTKKTSSKAKKATK